MGGSIIYGTLTPLLKLEIKGILQHELAVSVMSSGNHFLNIVESLRKSTMRSSKLYRSIRNVSSDLKAIKSSNREYNQK
jgi:hypothetical protein